MKSPYLLRIVGAGLCFLAIVIPLSGIIRVSVNGRVLGDILQNIFILCMSLFVLFPDEKRLQNALIIGCYTTVLDFILETAAVYLSWWFPLGGTQAPPLLVVPLEMVLGFFFFGMTIGIIFTFPRQVRDLNLNEVGNSILKKFLQFLKRLFPVKLDWAWLVGFVFISAYIGMNGDYNAGPAAWVPGPGWQMIYTFFVWFFGGISMLALFFLLENTRIRAEKI